MGHLVFLPLAPYNTLANCYRMRSVRWQIATVCAVCASNLLPYAQCTLTKLITSRSHDTICRLDCREINSLTHSHLVVLICAAKAFYSCPAIISQRLESRIISKEPQENTEEESEIIQARSHINSEKSTRNYKPSDEWAKPNFTPDVMPPPKPVLGCVFWRLCTWWVPGLAL